MPSGQELRKFFHQFFFFDFKFELAHGLGLRAIKKIFVFRIGTYI